MKFPSRYRLILARLSEGASRREISEELDVTVERGRQLINEAKKWRADERRSESPTATFFYTERFGPKR